MGRRGRRAVLHQLRPQPGCDPWPHLGGALPKRGGDRLLPRFDRTHDRGAGCRVQAGLDGPDGRLGVGAEQLIEAVLEGVSLAGAALDDDQCRTIAQQVADVVTPGFMQIICRGCGEINTEAYMSEEEIEAAQAIAK